jgi:hypothetical protein
MQTHYLSFLLRIWRTDGDPPSFRFQLEDSATAAQVNFTTLESLTTHVKQEIHTMHAPKRIHKE